MIGDIVKRIEVIGGFQLENFKLDLIGEVCLNTLMSQKASMFKFPPCSASLISFKVKAGRADFKLERGQTDVVREYKSTSFVNGGPKIVIINSQSQLLKLEKKICNVFPFAESLIKDIKQDIQSQNSQIYLHDSDND